MDVVYDRPLSAVGDTAKAVSEWLNSLGIRYKNTRFDRYVRDIEEIQKKYLENTLKRLDGNSIQYFYAMYEISDLEFVCRAFSGNEPRGLINLLEKIVKGPDVTADEKGAAAQPRDFSFEAVIGARISASGMQVTFDESGDVVAGYPLGKMFFQCKRPSKIDTLRRRAKEAAKQLQKDLSAPFNLNSFGLIAIDATKLINPNLILYVAPNKSVSDKKHMDMLKKFCQAQVDKLISRNELYRHNNILGVMVRFSAQWRIQDTGTILYQHDVFTTYFKPPTQLHHDAMQSFTIKMQQRSPTF